jgi:hypothetical protein
MAERKYSLDFVTSAELSGARAAEVAVNKVGAAAKNTVADLDGQGVAFEKTSGKAANFGNAMLQGSRGIQDLSVAGIPGVVNNLEGLASALGLTAGAAGGITLVAVAVDLLVKNWDKIEAAFGAPEEVRAFWSAITPEEAQVKRLQDMATALENQAANYERIATARKAAIDAAREEEKQLEKRAELWKGITPTPKERGDLPPLPGTGPESQAMKDARAALAKSQEDVQAKMGTFQSLDAATEEQRRKVQEMNRIAALPERVKFANDQDARALAGLDTSFDEAGGANSPEQMRQAEEIRARIKQREADMRAQIKNVPGLTDGLTGDSEKDRAKLQERAREARETLANLEKQRVDAARRAEEAAQAQAKAEQGVATQSLNDTDATAAAGFKELGLPPAPRQFSGSDARGGLPDMSRIADGAAAQELKEAAALLERAQSGNNDAVRQVAGVVRTAVEAQRSKTNALRQELDALKSQVANLKFSQ